MKKNNKGFFLIETIVVITIITTIMAFVFPNVSNLYDNFNKQSRYYDQPEDIMTLRAIYHMCQEQIDKEIKEKGCLNYNNLTDIKIENETITNNINVTLYYAGYTSDFDDLEKDDSDFKQYLSRLKKNNYNPTAYEFRLIGIFEDEKHIKRYASIKMDGVRIEACVESEEGEEGE